MDSVKTSPSDIPPKMPPGPDLKTSVSFEFFPPKTEGGKDKLIEKAQMLVGAAPRFMSVTYGAGGSTKEGTIECVRRVYEATQVPTAAHLTYINCTIPEMERTADMLWDEGIRHIVALRGDLPEDLSWPLDVDENYYQFTSDFVTALKERHGFEISVGAYPEKHPDSPSVNADVMALKKKQDAGADRAITQFFFENETYYRFLDLAEKAHIHIPVLPGVLPISNYEKMCKFAKMCEATVPDWLRARCEKYQHNDDDMFKAAEEILVTQVEDLLANGVPHIHFYTLNKAKLSLAACRACGLDHHENTGQARKSSA